MFHLQHHRRIVRDIAYGLWFLINCPPHHHIDDIVLGTVLAYQGSHILPVTHDSDSVGNDLDFIHTMGYVNNADSFFP